MKKTIIFVSHDLDEALKIGSHIAIMESARIIQHGKPEDIVLNPSNAYVEDFVAHTNPLNVLRGRSLMTQVGNMERMGNALVLNGNQNSLVQLDNGTPVSANCGEQALNLTSWEESMPLEQVKENMLMVATPEISMRTAIELRYRSGRPVLMVEEGSVVGILSDHDFYHALLGKHFTQGSGSEAA